MTGTARRWLVLDAMLLGSTLATLSSGVLSVSVVPLMDEFRLGLPELPGHFLSGEISLKAVTSLKTLEEHALRKGPPVQDLAAFHQALVKAVRHGFDQAFGVAALLAVVGVVAALLLPKRLEKR